MTDLVEIMDTIAEVDGHITIRNLTLAQIDALKDKVVWNYNDRKSLEETIRFGGTYFRPEGAKEGLSIDTGSPHYDYEIKAVLLLMMHRGRIEGGETLKWRTAQIVCLMLVRLTKYYSQRGYASFRDLDIMPDLKLNNLIGGFLEDSASKGGLDARENTSSYRFADRAFKTLVNYGLISRIGFAELAYTLLGKGMTKHEKEFTLKHPVIPTGVMKKLIAECIAFIDCAEKNFNRFAKLFRQTHKVIKGKPGATLHASRFLRDKHAVAELQKLFDECYSALPRHTNTLIYTFTGMRSNESVSLQTDCAGHRIEDGEDLYFIKGLLSKTDGNVVTLDWICNEITYRAVTLLSKLNHLYYERAELVLESYHDTLTAELVNNLMHGLKDRKLFGVRPGIYSLYFLVSDRCGSADERTVLSLKRYRIEVDAVDIAQLNKLGCNYKSVSSNGGNRGKPYVAGDYINLTPHQFRHTFAWFIVANRLGDLDDVKYQFKHLDDAMTYIYAQRAYETMDELATCIEDFDQLMNGNAVRDIIQCAESGKIAGGGGERLAKIIQELQRGVEDKMYSDDHQPHFKSVRDLIAFIVRHADTIRGLPHGYCTRGAFCKIKNVSDPSHCMYCDTYYALPKHLPYWLAIKNNCETRLKGIADSPEYIKGKLKSYRQALIDNLSAADTIIARLDPAKALGGSV